MRDDLQFAALHSDDALLDALGARTPGASLGVAAGVDASASPDLAARLLGAWTHEIDTRPGPLTDLLSAGAAVPSGGIDRPLAAIEVDAVHTGEGRVARLHARPRRSAMPRGAAVATAACLVLGLGGAAAAVSGSGSLDSIRRAVGAAPASDSQSPAERASALLAAAEEALDAGDLNLAADRMTRAQYLLAEISDARVARTLRAKMAALQTRWQRIVAPVSGALPKGEQSDKPGGMLPLLTDPESADSTPYAQPGATAPGAVEDPRDPQLVPDAGVDDPSHKLPLPSDPGLHSAKEDLADTREELRDKAKDKLDKDELKSLPERKAPPEVPKEPMPGDLPGPDEGSLGGLDPGSRPFTL